MCFHAAFERPLRLEAERNPEGFRNRTESLVRHGVLFERGSGTAIGALRRIVGRWSEAGRDGYWRSSATGKTRTRRKRAEFFGGDARGELGKDRGVVPVAGGGAG